MRWEGTVPRSGASARSSDALASAWSPSASWAALLRSHTSGTPALIARGLFGRAHGLLVVSAVEGGQREEAEAQEVTVAAEVERSLRVDHGCCGGASVGVGEGSASRGSRGWQPAAGRGNGPCTATA